MTQAFLSDLARARALFQQRAIAAHITGRLQPWCSICGMTHRACECPLSHPDAARFGVSGRAVDPTGGTPTLTQPGRKARKDAIDGDGQFDRLTHSQPNSSGGQ